jgi:8-oxo-dGTP pyrophosphatase MutT (NUDIX family)
MWTYVIAFTTDLRRFMMVRSQKRGGWEMPGGRAEGEETPLEASMREFKEETGYSLVSKEEWITDLQDGFVHFGLIGDGSPTKRKTDEIIEVGLFTKLPDELAYPSVEYEPLIEMGRSLLSGPN